MKHSKVVLVSKNKYSSETDDLILSLLEQGYELFCVVGEDCEKIEDVIDELAIGDGSSPKRVTTTSHPNESLDEVVQFATMMNLNEKSGVEVVGI
ncbi:hypothetical protein QTP81_13670 [Alteromonas sp. ASW11-36]|uniref:DUF7684 domain-containing protein n=1 Tax=Alteromonas arenosi TaxID=3055817 RepID=A0ABT7T1G7_9ALTE|nr:hypothetical protein [Alteromonas sp. ASW11-36]MDM7861219.1 hypothetical protein [Alteromonas sp. ASW11-36]MDM7861644.1 hypothetical protein [Alteromonas sp. ASW11-36]